MCKKGIYIVRFVNGCKIGISNDCEKRISSYTSPWCQDIRQAEYLPCQYPRIIEMQLLNAFKRSRKGEFIYGDRYEEIKVIITNNRYSTPPYMMFDKYFTKLDWVTLNID